MAALSSLTDDLVTGLELIDAATQEGDTAKMAEGNQLVQDAAAALVNVTPELQRLRDEYGLACVLPLGGKLHTEVQERGYSP